MSMLGMIFTVCIIVGGGFIIYLKTPSGKKWLKDL